MGARRPLVLVGGKTRQMSVEEFNDLRWQMLPLGMAFPIWTHMAGAQIPPTDSQNYRYIKLTASDSYNSGVLTSETVSGSAPHVQASAVISDPSGPMNGATVRLINTGRWLFRPGESGVVELDSLQGHTYAGDANVKFRDVGYLIAGLGPTRLAALTSVNPGNDLKIVSDGLNGVPRLGNATRDRSVGADYFMRIR